MNVYVGTSGELKNAYIGGKLPAAYQGVEYIQSSGTQYIDTRVLGSVVNEIEMTFSYPILPSAVVSMSGTREASNTACTTVRIDESNKIVPRFGNAVDTTVQITANTIYKVKTKYQSGSQTVWVNDVKKATGTLSYTYNNWLTNYLFALHDTSGATYFGKFKMYGCKMSRDGVPVRDFVPCYRKSDSVIGLYDLLNDVFYTNAGTGTFSKGANI